MGLSIGCKYTALILYFAYAAAEIAASLGDRHLPPAGRHDGGRLSRNFCAGFLVGAGALFLLTAWFLPVHAILVRLLALRADYQAGPGSFYVEVFRHLRRTLAELGLLSVALAALCRWSRDVYEALAMKRLYLALGIILLLSILCTPYCVVHPLQFAFDLGSLTRSNIAVAGGHAQWATYLRWLVSSEGVLPVAAGVVGVAFFFARGVRRFQIIAIYLGMYLYVLGSSQRGYPRYLAPVLPLLYCGTGFVVDRLWNGLSGKFLRYWGKPIAVLAIVGFAVSGVLHVVTARRQAHATNSFFASYTAAKQTQGTVYYAGYSPSIELQEAGVKTQELKFVSLAQRPLGQGLTCADALILDTPQAARYNIQARQDRSVTVLVDAPAPGQEAQQVLRASGCP